MARFPSRIDSLPARLLPGGLVLREASTFASRTRGLAGLDELPGHVGLLIPRCRSVHTFGMRFPIDVIFLGAGGRVVRVAQRVGPRRVLGSRAARAVVEVRADAAARFIAAGVGAAS